MRAVAWGLVRMWRARTVLVPVVLANALVQALCVGPALGTSGGVALVAAIVSAIAFLLAFGLVASCALQVSAGHVAWRDAVRVLRAHLARYVIWAVVLGAAVIVGLALWTIPGLVVLAGTPFLLLAAIEGERNPLVTNVRVIGRRFWGWLLTALIAGFMLLVGDLLAGVTAFFVRGSLASFLVWTAAGLAAAWFTTSWAFIYRSATRADAEPEDPSDDAPENPELDADEAPTYP